MSKQVRKKYKLTWDETRRRWRKCYKGKVHYFNVADGESKASSYQRCFQLWRDKKAELDSKLESDKPHTADYAKAIEIRRKLVDYIDHEGLTDNLAIEQQTKWQAEIEKLQHNFSRVRPPELDQPGSIYIDPTVGLKRYTETRWLKVVEALQIFKHSQRQVKHSDTIGGNIESYLSSRKLDVDSGVIKASGYDGMKWRIEQFKHFAGQAAVKELEHSLLETFAEHLKRKIATNNTTTNNAAQTLNAARAFTRWCWRRNIIETMPRCIESVKITVDTTDIETWTLDEVKQALELAVDRTKLWLLLMLNCGLYQADISALKQSEVDWTKGTITRKRTKTKRIKKVPTVTYTLWDETFNLLKQHRSNDEHLVFLTNNNTPLKVRYIKTDGKPYHVDNVAKRFEHLRKQLPHKKQLMELRKTSATKIEEHLHYGRYTEYFLGKAPSSDTEKKYGKPSQELFVDVCKWLGEQFGYPTSR